MHSLWMAGDCLKIKTLSLGIPIIKIRLSHDCLIFNMGIPIPGKTVIFLDKAQVSWLHSLNGPKLHSDHALWWCHNGHNGISNHQPHDCLLNIFIQMQIKENIKSPHHWPLSGELTGDRWISHTNGQ